MSETLLSGYGNISVLHEVSRDMSNMGRMKVRFTGYADMADEELQTELQTEPAQNDTEDHKPGSSGEKCQTKVYA